MGWGGGALAQVLGRRLQRRCSLGFSVAGPTLVISAILTRLHVTSEAKSESYVFVFFRVRLRRGKGKNSQEQMHPP